MGSDGEDEEIPQTTNHPKPIYKKRSILFSCLCVLILLAILILVIVILVLVGYWESGDDEDADQVKDTEWVTLEIPLELSSVVPFNQTRQLRIRRGFGITAYAHVPSPRFLLSLPNGDALVSQPNEGKISLLKNPQFRARPAIRSDFATGLQLPNDMVLYTDDNNNQYLYFTEATRVSRALYVKGDTRMRPRQVIVDNLPFSQDDVHPHKTIAIVNQTLYVSIGSTLDANPTDLQSDPKRGAIYGYPLIGKKRRLISSGLRHAEGLAVVPNTNELWAVVQQRDKISYPYRNPKTRYGRPDDMEWTFKNPLDEFVKIVEGENFGWPFCNYIRNESYVGYVPDHDFNPDERSVSCSKFRKVDVGLDPHTKPLGLTFWNGNNVNETFNAETIAIIVLHDNLMLGNKVIYYPWRGNKPGKYAKILVSGWVMGEGWKRTRWGRPVDTAIIKDESVLISDDYSGIIYKMYKKVSHLS